MPELSGDGWSLWYETYGERAEGLPLLLIHGFTASASSWLPQIETPSGSRFLIVPELPSHGRSRGQPRACTMEGLSGLMARLLDHLAVDRTDVAGHSFGGALALRFAAEFPDKVRSVTVINSNSGAADERFRERMIPGLERMAAALRSRGITALQDSPINPARGRRLPEELRQQLEQDFLALDPEAIAEFALAAMPDSSALPYLEKVAAPVLVVVGTRDQEFVGRYRNIVNGLADVQVREIEGAGHAAHLEQPEAFERLLREFLASPASA
jgi:pimeloyl-ACP methyl ester carboxylesterase